MNAHIGTHFSVDSHWEVIFKDETAFPDDVIASLNPDDDYDLESRDLMTPPHSSFVGRIASLLVFINTFVPQAETNIEMGAMSWPTQDELHEIRQIVSEIAGKRYRGLSDCFISLPYLPTGSSCRPSGLIVQENSN